MLTGKMIKNESKWRILRFFCTLLFQVSQNIFKWLCSEGCVLLLSFSQCPFRDLFSKIHGSNAMKFRPFITTTFSCWVTLPLYSNGQKFHLQKPQTAKVDASILHPQMLYYSFNPLLKLFFWGVAGCFRVWSTYVV